MATLKQTAEFAEHPDANALVMAAMVKSAVNISSEDKSTPNHANRVALAHSVLARPGTHVQSFAWAVATNATVVGKWASGDRDGAAADLEFVLGSIWDALAGPAPAE